jgi:hypothetical protein
MKYIHYIFVISLLISCRKGHLGKSQALPDTTSIPGSTPVNTDLVVYLTNWMWDPGPTGIRYNGVLLPSYMSGYSTGMTSTDEYTSVVGVLDPSNFLIPKVFPVTNAAKNYVDAMAYINLSSLNVLIYTGGTYALPEGGNLILPNEPFGVPSSGALNRYMNFGYMHPADSNYTAMLPCYPFADDNGQRWFLSSYGTCYIESVADFAPPTGSAVLQIPIVASQQATAPDSIPVWNLNSGNYWQKYGYAHRTGNFYSGAINHVGFWNFATERPGIYRTIHLQTPSEAPVVNTRIVLKDTIGEVADGRTDMDGNVQLFLPGDEPVNLELVSDQYNNWAKVNLSDQPITTSSTSSTWNFTVPDRQDLVMINGTAFNCDGSSLTTGTAVIANAAAWDNYSFPIVNGKFKMSEWINYGNNLGNIVLEDANGNPLDTTNIAMGSWYAPAGLTYNVNLYGCPNSSQLYCNYTLDGTSYSITGTTSSANPILTEASTDIVKMVSNGNGIMFQGWIDQILGNYFWWSSIDSLPTGLQVNGVNYSFGPTCDLEISRDDSGPGGFVEGWFYITYADDNNVTHTTYGNFRVKKI